MRLTVYVVIWVLLFLAGLIVGSMEAGAERRIQYGIKNHLAAELPAACRPNEFFIVTDADGDANCRTGTGSAGDGYEWCMCQSDGSTIAPFSGSFLTSGTAVATVSPLSGSTSIQDAIDAVHGVGTDILRYVLLAPGEYEESFTCNPPDEGDTFLIGSGHDHPVHGHVLGHFHGATRIKLPDDDTEDTFVATLQGRCHVLDMSLGVGEATASRVDNGDGIVRFLGGGANIRNVVVHMVQYAQRNSAILVDGAFPGDLLADNLLNVENAVVYADCKDGSETGGENGAIVISANSNAVGAHLFEFRNAYIKTSGNCPSDYATVRMAGAAPAKLFWTPAINMNCRGDCFSVDSDMNHGIEIKGPWSVARQGGSPRVFNFTGGGTGVLGIELGFFEVTSPAQGFTPSVWNGIKPSGMGSWQGQGAPAEPCFPGWTYRRTDPAASGSGLYVCDEDGTPGGTGTWVAK